MSLPATSTVPEVGVSTQPMRLSSVVLPLPDGPAIDRNSPPRTSRVMPAQRRDHDLAQRVVLDGVLDRDDRCHESVLPCANNEPARRSIQI